jgi:nucleotide-binding universal stress UspA family protein
MGYVDLGDALYQMEKAERANSHALLKDLAKIVKDHGAAVRAVALRGDAREELLRKVTELEASALVVGSRGLGVIKRAFLGSVSDYLAHNCSIPLVIVKDDK